MFKNICKLGLAGIAGVSIALAAPVKAGADYPTKSRNATPMNQTILEPGWRSSCDTSFVVENLGDDWVEVKITMGKDGIIKDSIQNWDKRGYDLRYNLSFSKQLGKSVNIDDVAIIENLSKDSKINVHC
ncbi:MAG: hypothetical protein O3A78_04670 [Nitrospinae bacterium]|jgi:hypothetical protein|nr:hypothetical protein [Nitrospinota bacterium]MDA1109097.1 hypothetical protein [Nitrospinota bacterium]